MKKAILVDFNFMVRLIVDHNTTELEIAEMATEKIMAKLDNDEAFENMLEIEDDDECPYGTFENDINN